MQAIYPTAQNFQMEEGVTLIVDNLLAVPRVKYMRHYKCASISKEIKDKRESKNMILISVTRK